MDANWTKSRVWNCDAETATVDFGVNDSSGRSVGVELLVWHKPDEGVDQWGVRHEGGWRYSVQAMRAGKCFGATQCGTKAESEADAKAKALKGMEAAMRRVMKSTKDGVYLTASEAKRGVRVSGEGA